MKKIIALLLSLVMLLSLTITSSAEEYMVESMEGWGQTEILAHIYSTYTITIPATIDLRESNQSTITISNAVLEDGYEVNVYCTNIDDSINGIIMYNVSNNPNTASCAILDENGIRMTAKTPLATFNQTDITSHTTTRNFQLELITNDAVAGDYTGIADFHFECTPIQ